MPRSIGRGRRVVVLGFLILLVDGFDLAVYGTVLPALLDYEPWALTAAEAGGIASLALLGQILGALAAGRLTDRFGRRTMLLVSVPLFSVMTLVSAVAPGPAWFAVSRLLVGLALGGVLPTAVALALEYAPAGRRNFAGSAVQAGYGLGAIIVALVAVWVLPVYGFRTMFVIGGLLGLVMLPFLWRFLPESAAFLMARGKADRARELANRHGVSVPADPSPDREAATTSATSAARVMLSRGYRRATFALPVSGFFGILLSFGLLTWLPVVLRQQGHTLGSALLTLVALNAGNVLGCLLLSRVADRVGPRTTVVAGFLVAAVCVGLLAFPVPGPLVYVLVLTAGFTGFGSQVVAWSFAGQSYPAEVRGTALGMTTGLARIGGIVGPALGGLLVGAAVAPGWSFVTFAAAAACASVVMCIAPEARSTNTRSRDADLLPSGERTTP